MIDWGMLTLAASITGSLFAFSRYLLFKKMNDKMAKRLSMVFFTDSLFFGVTMLFGLATFIQKDYDFLLYPLRFSIICVNIYYAYRLTRPL